MNKFEFARNLENRLLEFSKKTARFCFNLPRDPITRNYSDQLSRSSSSIGANYIEANESISVKDFFHRCKICRKESKETIYWLNLILDINPSLENLINILISEADEYLRLFSSIISKSKID